MKTASSLALNLAKRALLGFAGIAVVAIVLVNASQIRAQFRAASQNLRFEVASVKPHAPGGRMGLPGIEPGGRFRSSVPLSSVIAAAYNLPLSEIMRTSRSSSDRLAGLPDWAYTMDGVYDMEATSVLPAGLSVQARNDRMRIMLQTLLTERFKLVIHREAREMPVYALLVSKGGPKLQRADIEEKDCPDEAALSALTKLSERNVYAACHVLNGDWEIGLHGRAVTMSDLVNFVRADRLLVDKTGIKGLYRIETTGWLPMDGPPLPPGTKLFDGTDMADAPTLSAVFEKLGLKMEPQKAKVDVFVVDHVARPSGN